MIVKLLSEQHLEFLIYTGSSESTPKESSNAYTFVLAFP